MCAAALLTLGVVGFPPHWRTTPVTAAPPLPEAISYRAPSSNPDPQAAPVAPAVAQVAAPAASAVKPAASQATLASVAGKPRADGRKTKSADPDASGASASHGAIQTAGGAANALTPAPAPVAAQIAMAGGTQDPSGLNPAFVGRTYRQSIRIDGYDLPLPAGEWAVLARGGVHSKGYVGSAYFMGRIEHKRLVGAIRIAAVHADPTQSAPAIRSLNGCMEGNPNTNYVFVDSSDAPGLGCWLINNYYTPPWNAWADRAMRIDGLDRRAAGDLAAKGVDYPQDLMFVRFSRLESWGLLEVSYMFSPELDGIKSGSVLSAGESDWHATHIGRFPEKLAYVDKLRAWGQGFWPKFKQAFDSGKPATPAASAASAAAS
ncbi:hypothetical protein G3N92_05190 [Burkholderia sp. Ac-20379]|nr:hypothetical protein [Burkholderia sp. Ac-20379]